MSTRAIAAAPPQYNVFSSYAQKKDSGDTSTPAPEQSNNKEAAKDSFYTSAMFSRMPSRSMTLNRTPDAALRGSLHSATQLRQTGMNLGISMGVYGGYSLFRQTMSVIKGDQTAEGASAVILSDIMRSGVVGLGASAGGNMMDLAIQRLPLGTGLWTTVATVVGSAVGASMGRSVMDALDLRSMLMGMIKDPETARLNGLDATSADAAGTPGTSAL